MQKIITETTVHTIDIAKHSFAVHGFDADGRTVLKKELRLRITVDYGDSALNQLNALSP